MTIGIVRRQLAEVSQSEALRGVDKRVAKSGKEKESVVPTPKVSEIRTMIDMDSMGELDGIEGEDFILDLRLTNIHCGKSSTMMVMVKIGIVTSCWKVYGCS